MKILIFCMVLLAVNSLVPNCAFQSNNKCLSCYYGFQLVSGRCDTCSLGFVMVRQICVDQALYQQQVNLQNHLNALNTTTQTTTQQSQTQTQTRSVPTATTILPAQNTQDINQIQTTQQNTNRVSTTSLPVQTVSTTSVSTNSNSMTFDISNTGVMYLLQMFGLASKIPLNCQQFTNDFRCVKCLVGYVVSPAATCVMVPASTITTATGTGTTSSTSQSSSISSSSQTSTSTTQQEQSSGSSTTSNNTNLSSSTTGGNLVTVSNNINNDPNCQYQGQNEQCSQCYFRYFYSLNEKKCIQVNDLCATWDKLGNCLTCYGGYSLANGVCFIDYQSSGSSSTTNNVQGSKSNSGSNTQLTTSTTTSGSTASQPSQSTSTSTSTSQTNVINNQQSGTSSSTSENIVLITSNDPNCKSLGSNGICYECYYSFYYNSQSMRCVSVNPLCQTWNYIGHCFSCFPGYVLNGTQCVLSNASGNNGGSSSSNNLSGVSSSTSSTTTSSSTSSTGSSSSTTSVQISGTSSTGNGQITINNNDPNCRTPNFDGTCSLCYNTFYYDSVNLKRCVSVNPLCKTWNSWGYCLSCYQGYILSLNNCVIQSAFIPSVLVGSNDLPSTDQDPNCNTYKNQVCIKCATRTYLDPTAKRCLAVDANCMQWTETGICTNCYNGYYLFNQRQCRLFYPQVASVQLKSSSNSDINCRASDSNGVCTQCIWRYVLNPTSKICMKVHDQCRTWSETTALCTSCYGGYTLTNGGSCKVSY